jgi:HEAT repeat protein
MKRLVAGFTCLLLVFAVSPVRSQTAKLEKEVADYIRILKTSKDGKTRADAVAGLIEIAEIRAGLVKPAIPVLVASLKDAEVEVRKGSVNLLAAIEPYSKDWVPNLKGLLADGEDREVRIAAVNILGGIENGVPEVIPLFDELQKKEAAKAEGDRDNELLQAIANATEGIRDQLVAGQINTLATDKDAKKRLAAAVELTKAAQAKVERVKPYVENLLGALKDDNAAVRGAVVGVLSVSGAEPGDLVPALIMVLRNVREERGVRLSVIGLLGALGPAAGDAVPFLEVIHGNEGKKAEDKRDKELFEKVAQALEAIKKQQ